VAGKPFWVRPLSAEGWGILMAWLDDFTPGRDDRNGPPRMDNEACKELLATPEGEVVKLWLAVRDQGLDYEAATELWKASDHGSDLAQIDSVLFSRRRTVIPDPAQDDSRNIAETWCGTGLGRLAAAIGLEELGRYTLDQLEFLLKEGDTENENPAFSPEALAKVQADMMAKWGDKLAALNITPDTRPEPVKAAALSVTEELAAMGLRIKQEEPVNE
jgi:hypothetical protein